MVAELDGEVPGLECASERSGRTTQPPRVVSLTGQQERALLDRETLVGASPLEHLDRQLVMLHPPEDLRRTGQRGGRRELVEHRQGRPHEPNAVPSNPPFTGEAEQPSERRGRERGGKAIAAPPDRRRCFSDPDRARPIAGHDPEVDHLGQ
ncbi:MAG: hypothetical protein R2749_13590 [Acidimicrobiales bacterium]